MNRFAPCSFEPKTNWFSALPLGTINPSSRTVPPQLMITSCASFSGADFDAFQKSQMWDCMEDRDRIFAECRYQVVATDLLAAGLSARERAQLDMDFMEALAELYPACEAIYFQASGSCSQSGTFAGTKSPERIGLFILPSTPAFSISKVRMTCW